jgi:3-phosphoshikimate 1-carboxyvinyltransferase
MTVALAEHLRPATSLNGELRLPSDKSIAHRALICAALGAGESTIVLRQPGDDVLSTIGALRSLGVEIEAHGGERRDELTVAVTGLGGHERLGELRGGEAYCGNSGTSMRLLSGTLAATHATVLLTGDESLSRRPMERVARPLRAMGAEIALDDGHAPMTIRGRRPLLALDHDLPISSAQVLGAISLAALAADGTTTIHVPGLVRDHTERLLGALGADVQREADPDGSTTTIHGPAALDAFELIVPGDFSSAAAWLVAAAIHPNAGIRLVDVGLNPSRVALLEVLRSMGADIVATPTHERLGEPVGEVRVRGGVDLRAVSLGPSDIAPLIDELPLIAVAMAAAGGTSEVRGAAELRVKESDRIATMTAALSAAGPRVEELSDGWRIERGMPSAATVTTHGDHRVAMAMAVAAWTGIATGVELDDPVCVAVSYPSFWDDARSIGALA